MYLLDESILLETIARENSSKLAEWEAALNAEVAMKAKAQETARVQSERSQLGSIARSVLEELEGKPGYYWKNHYWEIPSNRTQLEIGKAMALSGRSFGVLDEIALDAYRHILQGDRAEILSFPNSTDSPRRFDYDYLQANVLTKLLGDWGDDSLQLKLKERHGSTLLQYSVVGNKLTWDARGHLGQWKSHRELADRLNGVQLDYENRLAMMESYRSAIPKPGLSESALSDLRRAIGIFFRYPFDLSDFKPGISFGDDPIVLDTDGKAKAFIARCESCELPVFLEIYQSFSRDYEIDWSFSKDVYENEIPERYANDILIPNHSRTGCRYNHAKSSRTGERFQILAR